jgi:EamA-like transporter family.
MKHVANKDWISLGIGTCILEIIALTTIATIVKYLSPEIQIITILFFRYAFSLPLLFLFGFFQRGKNLLKINSRLTLAIRIGVGITGLASYFMAIGIIGIGKTIALGQLVTIFISILAPLILAEKVGVNRAGLR